MRTCGISCLVLLATVAAPAVAADSDGLVPPIAPFLDDQVVAVVRIDAAALNVAGASERLARLTALPANQVAAFQKKAAEMVTGFTQAGGKEIYFVFSLDDLPTGFFAVVPLTDKADRKQLSAWLARLFENSPMEETTSAVMAAALVAGPKPTLERLRQMKGAPRPEAGAAFSAAGDAAVQVLLLPGAPLRRAIEEIAPQLPAELGGGPSTTFTRGLLWGAVGIDLAPSFQARLTIQSRDAEHARSLHESLKRLGPALAKQDELRRNVPKLERLATLLLPTLQNDRLTLTIKDDQKEVAESMRAVFQGQQLQAASAQTKNNLKQIGLAMYNYHDKYETFPPAARLDKQGKALLSWRVLILPYIEQLALYEQFHLDEPWDSPHNRKLIPLMPKTYLSRGGAAAEPGTTCLRVVVGKDTMFTGAAKGLAIREVVDGTSNTILVVEAAESVVWTKPDELIYDAKKLPALGRLLPDGFLVAMCDGSVRVVKKTVKEQTLRNALLRNDGNPLGPDW